MRSYRHLLIVLALATSACAHGTSTQKSAAMAPPVATPGVQASRQELEATLAQAHGRGGPQVAEIQRRLRDGDFFPGDRIFLQVEAETTLTDTFTVRTGPTLQLPNISPLPLRGVLRSELDSVVTQHVAKYIKNPHVDAVALIRVAVLGGVTKPGFYDLPAELRASDMVMLAGGPTGDSQLDRTVVKRGSTTLMQEQEVQTAFEQGKSLDQLNLNSGDELVVGKGPRGLAKYFPLIGVFTGLVFAITRL